jgi:hypothetical protein
MRQSFGAPPASCSQFGWSLKAHQALNKAVANAARQDALGQFFQTHLPEINQAASQIDIEPQKPQHYVNLEALGSNKHPLPKGTKALERFDSKHLDRLKTQWEATPLSWEQLKQESYHAFPEEISVFEAIDRCKTNIASAFKQKEEPSVPFTAQQKHQLVFNLAKLSHLVADLHQPQHTTKLSDWRLPGLELELERLEKPLSAHQKNQVGKATEPMIETEVVNLPRPRAHTYFEKVVERQDPRYEKWLQQNDQTFVRLWPKVGTLACEIQGSHAALFEMVKTQSALEEHHHPTKKEGKAPENKSFHEQLTTGWSQIAKQQMDRAVVSIVRVLASISDKAPSSPTEKPLLKEASVSPSFSVKG